MAEDQLFYDYFTQYVDTYKKGVVRDVTYTKYEQTSKWIYRICPNLKLSELNRFEYQKIINKYAESHEQTTCMDFHHHLKGVILEARDDGLIAIDPTRKAVIKGRIAKINKKNKFLNQFELQKLIEQLDLSNDVGSTDWLLYLIAKTGLRFAEALALTPNDFDFSKNAISVTKTWDYKKGTGNAPTKNKSSVRVVSLDWKTAMQFAQLIRGLPDDEPIFVPKDKAIFNSTVNDHLERQCKKAGISPITVHGLRHTHASILIFAGVSIASIAKRLGHSNMTTTQKTYLHIIQELENKDMDLIMRQLAVM